MSDLDLKTLTAKDYRALAVHDLWVDEIAGLVRGDMSKRVIVLVEEGPDAK